MPKVTVREEYDMSTRSEYTKVATVITVVVDGKELPNLEIVGRGLEAAKDEFSRVIKESYKTVPERV